MRTIHKLLLRNKKAGRVLLLLTSFGILAKPALAAGPPEPSIFSNPLALTLLSLMALLLIVIAVLANLLIGSADWKVQRKDNKQRSTTVNTMLVIGFMLLSPSLFAQDAAGSNTANTVQSIGGLSVSTFYVMASVIFLELFVILALLINTRFLIKSVKQQEAPAEAAAEAAVKKPTFTWWNKINRFKPVEQEADIDLGHDYDGIRELDNRLPPWWLWGFYITIVFAAVYLWRYHVSETAPLSQQEYEQSVARAEARIQEYLKEKGEAVNENSVTYLADAADLAEGKKHFINSCAACHKPDGAGEVGPNLADEYWIHGGDIKSIFRTIKYGVDGKGMASWQSVYSPKEIAQLASFVKSLHGTNPPNGKAAQGTLYKEEAAPAAPVADSADKKVAVK